MILLASSVNPGKSFLSALSFFFVKFEVKFLTVLVNPAVWVLFCQFTSCQIHQYFSLLISQSPGMLVGFALLQNVPDNPLRKKVYWFNE